MATRIDRRNRRYAAHGNNWVNLEFPFTSTGKTAEPFVFLRRLAGLSSELAEIVDGIPAMVAEMVETIVSLVGGVIPNDALPKED